MSDSWSQEEGQIWVTPHLLVVYSLVVGCHDVLLCCGVRWRVARVVQEMPDDGRIPMKVWGRGAGEGGGGRGPASSISFRNRLSNQLQAANAGCRAMKVET